VYFLRVESEPSLLEALVGARADDRADMAPSAAGRSSASSWKVLEEGAVMS
jgi:hypothetical protein